MPSEKGLYKCLSVIISQVFCLINNKMGKNLKTDKGNSDWNAFFFNCY